LIISTIAILTFIDLRLLTTTIIHSPRCNRLSSGRSCTRMTFHFLCHFATFSERGLYWPDGRRMAGVLGDRVGHTLDDSASQGRTRA
jgi:hypothetical protein